MQYHRDAQRDVLQVKVTDEGPAPVHVRHVRLDTTTFTAPVEVDKDSVVAPGLSADLTLPLGEVTCDDDEAAAAPAAPAAHAVTLEVEGVVVRLPVSDEVLGPIARRRCEVLAVTGQVDLALGSRWLDAGDVGGEPALLGTVVGTLRPGAGPVRLTVDGATTLFPVAEPASAELPMGATAPATLAVLLTVTRCDPHAVAEDKKGYLMPVRISVDGATQVLVEVAVPVPERAPLQDLIGRACGFPAPTS